MSANHPAIARILHVIDRLQDHPFRAHVVIYGEPGTGKEGLARLIHRLMHADNEAAPLERVNLAGCTADEMLKLLFGADTYRSGDGSIHGVRSGALMRAQGGSLIVDELLALPLDVQRHLGERLSEQRLGKDSRSSSGQPSNGVTLIGLTDGSLPRAVQQQLFRHDLAHRLMRIVLQVPPLRERPDDIAHSALWIANRVLRARGIQRPAELFESEASESLLSADAYRVTALAIAALKRHHWPGNFRDLQNFVERGGGEPGKGWKTIQDLREIASQHGAVPKRNLPAESGIDLGLQQPNG